jgi:hypothetical protein
LRQLGRGAEAADIAHSSYPQPAARKRFDQVVFEILSAHAVADAAGLGKPMAEIILELDHGLYACLKTLAADHRVNKRKVGVAKYIEAVLRQHVLRNGMTIPKS